MKKKISEPVDLKIEPAEPIPKTSLQEVLKPGEIIIKVAGQEYLVKTPFTFGFWMWFWNFLATEITTESIGNLLIDNIIKIQAELIKVSEDEIISEQTDDELRDALDLLLKQFGKEIQFSPFCKKALFLKGAKLRIKKTVNQAGGQ